MSVIPVLPTLIPGILPPSEAVWSLSKLGMAYFPFGAAILLIVPFFGMGKHSSASRWNMPGKIAWVSMEVPALLLTAYISNTLPSQVGIPGGFSGLPGPNKLMLGLYMLHYANRSLLTPILLTPEMAPIHIVPWFCALVFNTVNAYQMAGWMSGYGDVSGVEWVGSRVRIQCGLMIFCLGLFGNILHEDELREIRRKAKWEQQQKDKKDAAAGKEKKEGDKAERVYKIPQALGFGWIFYPHYLSEWIEWAGFWLIGGARFTPGRSFLLAEISAMLPQAYQGKQWYLQKFGKENVGNKKAIIPFVF